MVARSTFLIVLFVVLHSHSVIAQTSDSTESITTGETSTADETSIPYEASTTNETSSSTTTTTTSIPQTTAIPTTSCKYPDEFPLFSNDVCISRAAYTAIFLTSIILAGVSFLMLIGLSILYCSRNSGSSGSSYESDDESNKSNGAVSRKSSIVEATPQNKRNERNNVVVPSAVPSATPLRETKPIHSNQPTPNNHYMVVDQQEPPSTPSAPYTAAKPVLKNPTRTEPSTTPQPRHVNPKPPESHEMVPRPTTKSPTVTPRTQPSVPPETAAKQNGRSGRSRTNNPPPNDDTETSYF